MSTTSSRPGARPRLLLPDAGRPRSEAPRRLARLAGVLYLVVGVASTFAHVVVRQPARVSGDPAATGDALRAGAGVFRLAFAVDAVHLAAFALLALVLAALLGHVDRSAATAMVALVTVAVSVMGASLAGHLTAWRLATEPPTAAALGRDGADALALLALEQHAAGWVVAEVFFGLWLLPLAYLMWRSTWFPRALAVLLAVGCAGYLVDAIASALVDGGLGSVLTPVVLAPAGVAEVWAVGYLLVRGVRLPHRATGEDVPA